MGESKRRHRHPKRHRAIERAPCVRRIRFVVALGAVAVLAVIAAGLFWLVEPWRTERRLIQLAAERSVFVFGAHGTSEDFDRMIPHVDGAFRSARQRGQRVLFVQELGDVGCPDDPESGRPFSLQRWWDETQREPGACRRWFEKKVAGMNAIDERIREGRIGVPSYYAQEMGGFMLAMDSYLLQRRGDLAAVVNEKPLWDAHLLNLQFELEMGRALYAFCAGDPGRAQSHVTAAERIHAAEVEMRDRAMVLHVGQLLESRQDSRVVTIRGIAHWPMVEMYGLTGHIDRSKLSAPAWSATQELRLARIRGDRIPESEVTRRLLLEPLLRLSFDHLAEEAGEEERDSVAQLLSRAPALHAMPASQIAQLSAALGRRTASTRYPLRSGRAILVQLLRDRGLLPPVDRRP